MMFSWQTFTESETSRHKAAMGDLMKRRREYLRLTQQEVADALTRMAQVSLMGAMYIAGHKDPKTTRGYLYASAEFKRDTHTQAAPLARLLVNVRSEKAKRRKLI